MTSPTPEGAARPGASEIKEAERAAQRKRRALGILCDKRGWFSGEVCGGRLYKTHDGVLVQPVTKEQGIRAKCERCSKRYRFDHPLAKTRHERGGG